MSCRAIAPHRWWMSESRGFGGPLGTLKGQKAWCQMFLQVAASHLQASKGLQDEKMSRVELTNVLEEAVVQREGPLVTLNKPQGLAVIGKAGDVTVHSVLPELSQRLGFDQPLEVVKAAEKESSGLVLLSGCPKTSENLRSYFIWSQRAKRPAVTYRAITVGIPNPSEGEVKTALKLEQKWGQKWDGDSLNLELYPPSTTVMEHNHPTRGLSSRRVARPSPRPEPRPKTGTRMKDKEGWRREPGSASVKGTRQVQEPVWLPSGQRWVKQTRGTWAPSPG
ncbi:mitochondrial mRNA pseudouridine synthase RPUSD3 isoform X2 [Tachyglossus aculeatus]|uniref:mitochondrial mRNA pseudouridine synthase RPUSD3 isoform X2 n=1 Tax=Tachyglossus aculeatus TaxID=9261 RepID=UPI0018F3F19D|nr:mitochondrial mRNA pseudouridine synthase RPUSD3 isoform X2 [Tachyglossus aculeatus]